MTQTTCPRCQTVIPAGRAISDCPVCLIQQAIDLDPKSLDRDVAPTLASGTPSDATEISEIAPHFPQLEILGIIGQGGMGAVYKAKQKALNRIVALKILSQNLADQAGFAERFQREAQTLAQLGHPNIVTIHEAGRNGPFYYLLMEFVEGTDLRHAMRTQALNPTQALEVVQQICAALQYAHEKGIVHRDIKPENILLDKTGTLKIADFGLAKLLRTENNEKSLTHTHQVMGTMHYMAPEQMEKPLTVDHRADIYSLGVVFYELLTGYLPVGRFKPPSTDSGADARLDEVVFRALEREPNERYQSASEVRYDVQRISSTSWQNNQSEFAPEAATPTRPAKLVSPAKPVKPEEATYTPNPLSPLTTHPIFSKFNPGALLFGIVMGGLGITLLIQTGLSSDVLTWVGLGLTLGGLGIISGGFKSEERPTYLTPNIGSILGGVAYIAIGAMMLIGERFDTGLFTWIGIGLVIAGGSFCSDAWKDSKRRLPLASPNFESLVMSIGMLALGVIFLVLRGGFDSGVMTWIGLGIYLAGASTLSDAWSEKEDAPSQ